MKKRVRICVVKGLEREGMQCIRKGGHAMHLLDFPFESNLHEKGIQLKK